MKTQHHVIPRYFLLVAMIATLSLLASSSWAQPATPARPGSLPQPQPTGDAPSAPSAASPRFVYPSNQPVPFTRIQLRPRASERYIVWIDRAESQRPEINPMYDQSDVLGLNLKTNQPIVVSDAPGVQTEPDVSGSIVVWQDMSHSCATCEADILGKNLDTGQTFTVASGPDADGTVDHAHPAISGKNVAWLELNKTTSSLKVKNLDTGAVKVLASTPRSSGISFNPPAMSDEYIVWSEVPPFSEANFGANVAQLRAYRINDGKVMTVAKDAIVGGGYAVADHRVIWSNSQLNLADLSTGTASVLYRGDAMTPAIGGNTVVWSVLNPNTDKLDVWGLDLRNLKPLPLVTDTGNKRSPIIAGDRLIWQNDGGVGAGSVTNTSLTDAFATAPAREKAMSHQIPTTPQPATQPAAKGASPSYNTYKGMWAAVDANYNGWGYNQYQNQAINALGADIGSPHFGSVEVLNSEMNYSTWGPTGGYAAWGPRVANAMRLYQETYNDKVILRINPTSVIQPYGDGAKPDDVAQKVLQSAGWRNWLRHIEVESEPNNEWLQTCTGCSWPGGGTYSWNGYTDYRLYRAINDFYVAVWYDLLYYQNNCSYGPNNNCQYLRNYTYWSPSMDPEYTPLTDGQPLFGDLTGMVNLYNCDCPGTGRQGGISYNVYPNPPKDATYGYLPNTSWKGFNIDQQTRISDGSLRSQITEFGWRPGSMQTCNIGQWQPWPGSGACHAADYVTHYFQNDLNYFLTSGERHNATSVVVWILRGWGDLPDGIDGSGNTQDWLRWYEGATP